MLRKDHNRGDRIEKRPSVINVHKTERDPYLVNEVKHVGVIPSTDLLVNALSTVPVPYGVVTNAPAVNTENPNLEYMRNFKNAYIGAKYADNIVKS